MLHVTYKTTDSIKVTTSSANTLVVVIDYSVRNGAAYPGKNAVASIAAATTTTVLAAPTEAESCFDIERMTFSASGGANTITVLRRVSGADYQETSVSLSSGDVLEYEDGTGYTTKDSNGSAKFSINNVTGNLTVGGTLGVTGATTLSAALTYGGVTLSNAVTGTENMVLSASPTFTGTLTAAAISVTTLSASSTITPAQVPGIVGTTTNNNAQAGSVGEIVSSQVLIANKVSLTNDTYSNITSISLTAGDWDLAGWTAFEGASATTVEKLVAAFSKTSGTEDTAQWRTAIAYPAAFSPFPIADISVPLPTLRISLSATTTFYLVAIATFAISTCNVYGNLWARRTR